MNKLIFLSLIFILLNFCVIAQNGEYVTNSYLYYQTETDQNPQETKNNFLLNLSISKFSGLGNITIKDITENDVVQHTLTGKFKEQYNSNTNQNMVAYYATLSAYGFSQPEFIILLFNATTNELDCIISKSIEHKSSGYYCNLVPIEETMSSTGSGFIVSSDGYIITNYHVVKGAKKIIVSGINGNYTEENEAYIKDYDKENDIALLKIKDKGYTIVYSISEKEYDVGEGVFVLGYPMISLMGSEIKLTDGLISSASGFMNNKLYYQISSPIQPGNSGCPLFDSKGNIIGLVTSKLNNGESVGYALKSNVLIKFLYTNGVSQPNSCKTIRQVSLPQKVKILKTNIITIESIR